MWIAQIVQCIASEYYRLITPFVHSRHSVSYTLGRLARYRGAMALYYLTKAVAVS